MFQISFCTELIPFLNNFLFLIVYLNPCCAFSVCRYKCIYFWYNWKSVRHAAKAKRAANRAENEMENIAGSW